MFRNKVEYEDDTNEKTHGSDDSPSETDCCVRNLAKEHENEEDKEFKEDTSEINDTNESKLSKDKTKEAIIISLLAKYFLLKVIQAVIFSINTYEQDIIAVGNENKKIKNKDRWNYCHHIPMLSLLGANHRLPLFHMAKHFFWLNETK